MDETLQRLLIALALFIDGRRTILKPNQTLLHCVPCVPAIGFLKAFAWVMVSRNSISREIKGLELRIAELAKLLSDKS